MIAMIAMLIFFGIITISLIGVFVRSIFIIDSCNHSYERIDTANDKKMILVCRRCGKIKKLKK